MQKQRHTALIRSKDESSQYTRGVFPLFEITKILEINWVIKKGGIRE